MKFIRSSIVLAGALVANYASTGTGTSMHLVDRKAINDARIRID
ncbi:MAG TPA: hypothetical protein VKF40_12740 [Burkholderiales bacterium]|nr:hypothetical protein [Burkholderiales bacterium]